MTTPIAEAFVTISPNTAGFAAALQRDVAAAMKKVDATLRTSTTSTNVFGGIGNSAKKASSDVDLLSKSVESLKGGLATLATSSIQVLQTSLKRATEAALAFGAGVTAVGLSSASNIQSATLAFHALSDEIGGGIEGADAFLQSLRDISTSTALNFGDLTGVAQQFLALEFGARGTKDLILDIGNALAASGKDGTALNQGLQGVATAISQIRGAGRLLAQDLNQITTRIPAVTRTKVYLELAKNIGIADKAAQHLTATQTEALRKRLDTTGIDSDTAIKSLDAVFQQVKGAQGALARNAQGTITGVLGNAKETIKLALGDAFNQPAILNGIKDLADSATTSLADIGPKIAGAFSSLLPLVQANLPALINALTDGFTELVSLSVHLAPLITDIVNGVGAFTRALTDAQVQGVLKDLEGAVEAIGRALFQLVGGTTGLKLLFAAFRELGDLVAALGDTLTALGPLFVGAGIVISGVLGVLAAGFDGLAQGVGVVNRLIDASFDGIADALGTITTGFQGVASAAAFFHIPGAREAADALRDASAAMHDFGNESVASANNATNALLQTRNVALDLDGRRVSIVVAVSSDPTVAGRPINSANGKPLQGPGLSNADQAFAKNADALRRSSAALISSAATSAGAGAASSGAAAAAKAAAAKAKTAASQLGKDVAAISKRTADQSIADIHREFDALTADLKDSGNKEFVASTNKIEANLVKVAKQRDKLNDQLKNATTNLASLKKESADYATSIRTTVNALGDVSQASKGINTTFVGIRGQLVSAIGTTTAFAAAIGQLTRAGLNKSSLKELIDAGPQAGLAAAQALAGSGAGGIAQINQLQAQLDAQGKALGASASNTLYTAGVRAAQGLVDGLKSQEAAIEAQMDRIANKMAAAIKKSLKIKSPSQRLYDEVGVPAGQGIINGLMGQIDKASGAGNSVRNYANSTINFGPGSVVAHGATEAGANRMGTGLGLGIADVLERVRARAVIDGHG